MVTDATTREPQPALDVPRQQHVRTTHAEDEAIAARTRMAQVKTIYRQANLSLSISLVIAVVWCFVLRDVASHSFLKGWLAIVFALAALRFVVVRAFYREERSIDDMPLWEFRFAVCLLASTLVWGIGGWLLMPSHSPLHQAVIYFFMMGMAGSNIVAFAAHIWCSRITLWAMLAPATLWFLVQGEPLLQVMGGAGLVYAVIAMKGARELGQMLQRMFQLSHDLRVAHDRAQELARIDDLSGMNNRRAFFDLGAAAFERARAGDGSFSLLMIDIDHFKSINDRFGHAAGDRVIRAIAEAIKQNVRAVDIAGRLGGEEFAVALPGTSRKDAMFLAERLRQSIAAMEIHHNGQTITLTGSLGLAESQGSLSLDTLIHEADSALYKAKANGRNRIEEAG
jgi:diguanylate cyclase (GGDEF)-like protein